MHVLIVVHHPFDLWCAPEWLAPRLREKFPQHTFEQLKDYNGIEENIGKANALIAWSIRPDQFVLAKKLKWIHSPAAAVHQLMFPEMVASRVMVTNAREIHAPVVAEHALSVMLALAKRLPSAVLMQSRKHWGQREMLENVPPVREVRGATVCVIGMGSIGREFTCRAKAMEMKVIGVRHEPKKGNEGADEIYGLDELHKVLPRADYVLLSVPLTRATHKLMNAEHISWMKKDSYLINVGRGPLIEDKALISALRENRIAGAALDTFDEEPLPESSSYWGMENVLITPHIAAVTHRLWERHWEQITENLRRYDAGEPLLGAVDKSKGY